MATPRLLLPSNEGDILVCYDRSKLCLYTLNGKLMRQAIFEDETIQVSDDAKEIRQKLKIIDSRVWFWIATVSMWWSEVIEGSFKSFEHMIYNLSMHILNVMPVFVRLPSLTIRSKYGSFSETFSFFTTRLWCLTRYLSKEWSERDRHVHLDTSWLAFRRDVWLFSTWILMRWISLDVRMH